ncbi:MAG: CsbD family protein [Rhodobacteraceae bacterium]|nr:CsbD family protein [Paracoccaceae bacterium]
MNWDIVKGNWNQWKGKVQQEWGKLTNDDLMRADGDREELKGILQERYGHTKEEVERQLDAWLSKSD